MLSVIEDLIVAALRPVLPADLEVVAGAATAPAAAPGRVAVLVGPLTVQLPDAAADPIEGREPAYAFRQQSLAHDAGAGAETGAEAGTSAYALPANALPELTEVQSPPGRILRPGDDYGVDGRTIRFRYPPAAAIAVLTRGAPAQGFRDTQPCQVDISLAAWATSIAAADAMAGSMLAAALGVFVRRDVIDLVTADAGGLLLRLLAPLARLASVERGEDTRDTARWPRTTIRLAVRGRLELMLAAEAREPEGVIQSIDYTFR
jgi:hypothetical protein